MVTIKRLGTDIKRKTREMAVVTADKTSSDIPYMSLVNSAL